MTLIHKRKSGNGAFVFIRFYGKAQAHGLKDDMEAINLRISRFREHDHRDVVSLLTSFRIER